MPYPSGRESGESIDTRSGLAAKVSPISSSSVLTHLVVTDAPCINAHPVALRSLPVRSIPTIRNGAAEFRQFFNSRFTNPLESDCGEIRFSTARLFERGS